VAAALTYDEREEDEDPPGRTGGDRHMKTLGFAPSPSDKKRARKEMEGNAEKKKPRDRRCATVGGVISVSPGRLGSSILREEEKKGDI